MAKKALGKGLGALISGASQRHSQPRDEAPLPSDPAKGDRIHQVGLDRIVPSPLQPRKSFEGEQLEELVDSIREHGVIQPLIVREVEGRLELIAGERRWRAATKLKLSEVPVIVREASDQDVLEMALIENLQREDLNPIEEGEAYRRLAKEFKMKQEEIARRVGKNRATVANAMRLLDLSAPVKLMVAQGQISNGHAKAILGIKQAGLQETIAASVIKNRLTVRDTEKLVSETLVSSPSSGGRKVVNRGDSTVDAAVRAVQKQLREHFATHVRVVHSDKKGKIEIEYYGNDDLARVLEVMGVTPE